MTTYDYKQTSLHVKIQTKKTQTSKITRLPDTNIPESTWECKITNNNNKYIFKTENWRLKKKMLIKFGFTDELMKELI